MLRYRGGAHIWGWIARVSRYGCPWLLLVTLPMVGTAAPSADAEYRLKAAMIYKLAKFVTWKGRTPDKAKSFGICLLGEDKFGSAFETLHDRKIRNNSIWIQRYSRSVAIDERCQIVFVSGSKQVFLEDIFSRLRQYQILTIGDSVRFAERGGIIQFTQKNKHIGFKINLDSAELSSLKIAAPLLELAKIVHSAERK